MEKIIGNVTSQETPGGFKWTCTCGEGTFQGDFAVSKGIAPVIEHKAKCSLYVEPAPRTFRNELAEEDYHQGRRGDGNSDTM